MSRPPGPRGLPLIGEARSFARDPLAFLTGVADKYGDIANFRLGGIDVFFVRHPDYVREVLITQRASFTMTALRARINAVVGEGLFTSRGELHARQKRLMLPVFRKSRIEAYAAQMAELSCRARDQWQSGTIVDIADEMMKLTMLIAAQALLNTTPRPTDAEIREAIGGNLCRCTGYQQIVDAVKHAAARLAAKT